MLNNLYRKLYLLFVSSVMLLITFVISSVTANAVHTERINESTFFQRMSTLLIYQMEHASSDMEALLKNYEDSYRIFTLLTDEKGDVVYQSDVSFSTSAELLRKEIEEQIDVNSLLPSGTETTSQSGILELQGEKSDTYFVIPATVVASGGAVYEAIFIYQINSLKMILQEILPLYLLVWLFAFFAVLLLSRFLLKKALAPTERILKSQKEFVAAASHELKSPLAVIVSNTDILLEDASLKEQSRQALQTIDGECMRLSRLVKDMLLLASSDAKSWTCHPSEINIDTLLITLYETYEPVCMENQIEIRLNLSEESYPAMFTDKDRLFQILCIFMDNAVSHSRNNPLIEILAEYDGKYIAFSVADHGQGISDEEKRFVFDRFYSGDKSRTNKSNFGLGLSIARELTQMLNGTIEVRDTPGGGAAFTVRFPLK